MSCVWISHTAPGELQSGRWDCTEWILGRFEKPMGWWYRLEEQEQNTSGMPHKHVRGKEMAVTFNIERPKTICTTWTSLKQINKSQTKIKDKWLKRHHQQCACRNKDIITYVLIIFFKTTIPHKITLCCSLMPLLLVGCYVYPAHKIPL